MSVHLTLNGKPWCRCGFTDVPPTIMAKITTQALQHNLLVICQYNSTTEAQFSQRLLADNGVEVEIVNGHCPTIREAHDD